VGWADHRLNAGRVHDRFEARCAVSVDTHNRVRFAAVPLSGGDWGWRKGTSPRWIYTGRGSKVSHLGARMQKRREWRARNALYGCRELILTDPSADPSSDSARWNAMNFASRANRSEPGPVMFKGLHPKRRQIRFRFFSSWQVSSGHWGAFCGPEL
jgi:hypothetical protein